MGTTIVLCSAIKVRRAGKDIFVLLDNQAAVGSLQTGKSSTYLWKTRVFHNVASKVKDEVKWLPGHSKISENEKVDAAALAAVQELPPQQILPEQISLVYKRHLMH